jgi:hypothetical protein
MRRRQARIHVSPQTDLAGVSARHGMRLRVLLTRQSPKWVEIRYVSRGAEQGPYICATTCMDGGPQKLRSLARQTRALAGTVGGRERADALQALARLYDKQADELELREVA